MPEPDDYVNVVTCRIRLHPVHGVIFHSKRNRQRLPQLTVQELQTAFLLPVPVPLGPFGKTAK